MAFEPHHTTPLQFPISHIYWYVFLFPVHTICGVAPFRRVQQLTPFVTIHCRTPCVPWSVLWFIFQVLGYLMTQKHLMTVASALIVCQCSMSSGFVFLFWRWPKITQQTLPPRWVVPMLLFSCNMVSVFVGVETCLTVQGPHDYINGNCLLALELIGRIKKQTWQCQKVIMHASG